MGSRRARCENLLVIVPLASGSRTRSVQDQDVDMDFLLLP